MKDRKNLLIMGLVILIIISATSGCITSESVSAAEIKSGALNSIEYVSSYRYAMNTVTETTESFNMTTTTVSLNAEGAVDMDNDRLSLEINSAGSEVMAGMDMELSVYIIDDSFYMKMNFMGYEQWMKMDGSEFGSSLESAWDSYDQMMAQKALLENSEVTRLPDEKINLHDCYVLKLIPSTEVLLETLTDQMGLSYGAFQESMDSFSYVIKEFEITLSIAKDTNFIMKIYEKISIEVGFDSYTTPCDMELTMLLTDHNTPVDVVLPEEAENAISYVTFLSNFSENLGPY